MFSSLFGAADSEIDWLLSQSSTIIAVTELLIAFVAVVVAGGAVWVGFWEKRTNRRIKDLESKLKEVRALQGQIAAMNAVASDLALSNLPLITYTQQIPLRSINSIRSMLSAFGESNGGAEVGSRGRALFATALLDLALNPSPAAELSRRESVVANLERAASYRSNDPAYFRDVSLRLCQAYRQYRDMDNATKVAEALRNHGVTAHDAPSRILGVWSAALIDLQRGLAATTPPERRARFQSAAIQMSTIFAEVFGWDRQDGVRGFSGLDEGSIAFYTAKSLWAYRMTFPQDTPAALLILDKFGQVSDLLVRSIDCALNRYEDVRSSAALDDPYVVAIYNFCVALLVSVLYSIPEIVPSNLRLLARNHHHLISSATARRHAASCLETARGTVYSLQQRRHDLGVDNIFLPGSIYTEALEMLASFVEFQHDVSLVGAALSDPSVLFVFYGHGNVVGTS